MEKQFEDHEILEQIKIEKRNYRKSYREANKARLKNHQAAYWRRRALKALEENEN